MTKAFYFICALLLAVNTYGEQAHHHKPAPQFDRDQALAFSQSAVGRQAENLSFTKTNGDIASLAAFRGRPLVISMIYTSCYHICPTTTKHLHKVVRKARAALGTDSFNVLTVGFDVAKDSPDMMQFFADRQGISDIGWHFLSADQETIDTLAETLGFIYFESPNGFDHLIQATILDSEGIVFRQVYGMNFDTPMLIEPLKQLVFKEAPDDSLFESLSNQVKLFCTVYDPAQDKYKFDYSLFIGMFIGFMCVGFVGYQLVREWRHTLSS